MNGLNSIVNPKMILTDLDGTLICSDGSISERTKSILKSCQNHGIYIAIATARYWIGAERYIEKIQPDYEITTDGTLIHRHGEEIYSCNLEIENTNQIIQDILAQDEKTEITVAAGRKVFWNSKHMIKPYYYFNLNCVYGSISQAFSPFCNHLRF